MSAQLDEYSLAGTWQLDVSRTTVEFHTKGMWIMKVTGTFRAETGSVVVREEGSVSGVLVFDALSVDTGLARRDSHLRSADFLHTVTYPTVTFTLAKGRMTGANEADLVGSLTVREVTRDLEFRGGVDVSDGTVTVTAMVDLDRRHWGMTFSKMGARFQTRVKVQAHLTRNSSR